MLINAGLGEDGMGWGHRARGGHLLSCKNWLWATNEVLPFPVVGDQWQRLL